MINPEICPFCHSANECGVNGVAPCWCTEIVIPQQLLELVPAAFQLKSCICRSCINSFNEDPARFESNIKVR